MVTVYVTSWEKRLRLKGLSDLVEKGHGTKQWLEITAGKSRLEIKHVVLTGSAMHGWNKLPREVVDSPYLDVFSSRMNVFLKEALAKHKVLGSIQG